MQRISKKERRQKALLLEHANIDKKLFDLTGLKHERETKSIGKDKIYAFVEYVKNESHKKPSWVTIIGSFEHIYGYYMGINCARENMEEKEDDFINQIFIECDVEHGISNVTPVCIISTIILNSDDSWKYGNVGNKHNTILVDLTIIQNYDVEPYVFEY